ncbi:MAG: alpha/beta fold hydrolase [Ginsengibacter sp.]
MQEVKSHQEEELHEEPYKVSTRRKIARWVTGVILLYGFIGYLLYTFQEKFLFHPEPLPSDYTFQFDDPFNEIFIAINSRDTLHMIQFLPKDTSMKKGVIIYFHGNRDNVNRYAKYASLFTNKGYEVWMPDYPGFGKSIGEISEKLMNTEAMEVYKLARSNFSADSIIIYGKSLGTGLASFVASERDCKRLILETPYYSIPSLIGSYAPIYPTEWMSHYKFPTGEYLKTVKEPITIFQGTSDRVVFYKNAAKLKQVLKSGDEFITIENGGHNNLAEYPQYKQTMDSLIQ